MPTMAANDWVFWCIVVMGAVGLGATLWAMYDQVKRVGIVDPAHASRWNHLESIGVREIKPFVPANDVIPVLTPEQEAEGWQVKNIGGMWVKTIDLDQVRTIQLKTAP